MPASAHDAFDGAANRLGALSRVLADNADDAMAATGRAAGSAAVALSALHHFLGAGGTRAAAPSPTPRHRWPRRPTGETTG
jgi:hypothetical protein